MQQGIPFGEPAIGFHVPKSFDKVFDVTHCYLQPDPSNQIRLAIKEIALREKISFFDLRKQTGYLRTVTVRIANTCETMVIIQVAYDVPDWLTVLMNELSNRFPSITSLQYVINGKKNDTFYDLDIVTWKGNPYITETMPWPDGSKNLQFRVGPKSFYQTNSEQAHKLYLAANELAELSGNELVYDLYTGTGTIALFLAQKAKKVVGVESVKEAIDDAWLNAEVNGITNADFVVGDMKDVFTTEFIETHGRPDVVVTDPPRDGMHQKVVQQLLELAAPRIVYVSCNPATQARDLALLSELYEVKLSRAVDMFPQTQHIENVVLLEKK